MELAIRPFGRLLLILNVDTNYNYILQPTPDLSQPRRPKSASLSVAVFLPGVSQVNYPSVGYDCTLIRW